MTLQQQLAEMREGVEKRDDDIARLVYMDSRFIKLLDTLQAILDIEKKPLLGTVGEIDEADGWNSALAAVAEAAGEGMRG